MKKIILLFLAMLAVSLMVSCESDIADEHFVNIKIDGSADDYHIDFTVREVGGAEIKRGEVLGRNLVEFNPEDDLEMIRRPETGFFKIPTNKDLEVTFDVWHWRENPVVTNGDTVMVNQWSHFEMAYDEPDFPEQFKVVYPYTIQTSAVRFNSGEVHVDSFSKEGRNDWNFIFKVENIQGADFIDCQIQPVRVSSTGI